MDLEKAAHAVADLLLALGVDQDDHTADTPTRVARAWAEHLAGYAENPADHLTRTFTAPHNPGLVIVSGIQFTSTCAHHLERIVGTATVAYRPHPGQPIVGLSKLARLVTGYARRLQVQERLGHQITHTIHTTLAPEGTGCILTATHGCMTLRGINQPTTATTTHAWAGAWNTNHPDTHAVLNEHNRSLTAPKGNPT